MNKKKHRHKYQIDLQKISNKRLNRQRDLKQVDVNYQLNEFEASPIEKMFYESKPFIIILMAALAMNYGAQSTLTGKASALLLFSMGFYIIYMRFNHRRKTT